MKTITLTESELAAVLVAAANYRESAPDLDLRSAMTKLSNFAEEHITNRMIEEPECTFTLMAIKPKVRYYRYFVVLEDNDNFVAGTLLTEKELQKAILRDRRCKSIKVKLVRVPANSLYYFFGVRFSTIKNLDYDE